MALKARLRQLIDAMSAPPTRLRVVLAGLAALFAGLQAGCTIECDYHYECQAQDPSRVYECVDRKCVAVEQDLGQSCTAPADCSGPGNYACVGGVCALQPECQQLHGSFAYAAACFPDVAYSGETTATTSDCVSSVSVTADPAFSLATTIAVNEGGYVEGLTSSANPCTAGAFDAKSGALFFDNCTTPVGGCDIALISASRGKKPCVVSTGAGCDVGETCAPLEAPATVGVCQ